jgi:hypothetical protein
MHHLRTHNNCHSSQIDSQIHSFQQRYKTLGNLLVHRYLPQRSILVGSLPRRVIIHLAKTALQFHQCCFSSLALPWNIQSTFLLMFREPMLSMTLLLSSFMLSLLSQRTSIWCNISLIQRFQSKSFEAIWVRLSYKK